MNLFEKFAAGQVFPALVTVCSHISNYLTMEVRKQIKLILKNWKSQSIGRPINYLRKYNTNQWGIFIWLITYLMICDVCKNHGLHREFTSMRSVEVFSQVYVLISEKWSLNGDREAAGRCTSSPITSHSFPSHLGQHHFSSNPCILLYFKPHNPVSCK